MHLTNYSINKNSDKFVFNNADKDDNIGHKRSLTQVLSTLEKTDNLDIPKLWSNIKDIIIKTLCCA